MSIEYKLQNNGDIVSIELDENHFFDFGGKRYVPGEAIKYHFSGDEFAQVKDRFYEVNKEGKELVLKPLQDMLVLAKVRGRFRNLMMQKGYEDHIGSTGNIPQTPLSMLTGEI